MIAGEKLRWQAEMLLANELKRTKGGTPKKRRVAERLEMLQALDAKNAATYQRMMRLRHQIGGPWV